jgi:hypothetical protein
MGDNGWIPGSGTKLSDALSRLLMPVWEVVHRLTLAVQTVVNTFEGWLGKWVEQPDQNDAFVLHLPRYKVAFP